MKLTLDSICFKYKVLKHNNLTQFYKEISFHMKHIQVKQNKQYI